VCRNGGWSDCIGSRSPVPEVCDRLDNDCDGGIDENVPDEQGGRPDDGENLCRPNCARCDVEWNPVCGQDQRVYASACLAQCMTGSPAIPLAECAIVEDADFQCENDDDCRRVARRGGLCVAQESDVNRSPPLGPLAQCIADTSECGCIQNRCSFRLDDNVGRCGVGVGIE
jgi:hypothetical protein